MFNFLIAAESSILSAEAKQFITDVVSPILMILMVILSLVMLFCILRQSGDPENLGALTGNTETFYGQNKERSKDYIFKKITIWTAVALVATSVIYFILQIL